MLAERTYTDRYGNTRTMNTANIGRRTEDVDEDTGEILLAQAGETVEQWKL